MDRSGAFAIRDQEEFVVESIVDSLIDDLPKRQFKVRWAGYDESYDELDWNSLKNVEALHN